MIGNERPFPYLYFLKGVGEGKPCEPKMTYSIEIWMDFYIPDDIIFELVTTIQILLATITLLVRLVHFGRSHFAAI